MALSEAKKAADKRYTSKLDNIMIRPYREEGTMIRTAAAVAGMSVQAYVLRAVRAWMEREKTGSAAPAGIETGSMPAAGDGFVISAGRREESGWLPRTLEDRVSKSRRDADEEADDWTARLSRSPNRARTVKVIKRITEANGDKGDK